MVDVTNTVHPQLAAHADAYFRRLPEMASRPNAKVVAGVYVDNTGQAAFTEFGQSRTPTYVLRASTHDGALTNGRVTFANTSLATADTTATGLVILEEKADAVADDAETLSRLLAPYGDEGAAWASAIAGAPDRAQRFGRTIGDISGVPPGAPVQDEVVLVAYLVRHFSYGTTGQYYAKWAGSGRNFPADTSDAYKQQAVAERQLDRDNFYCLSVLTDGEAGSDGTFRAIEQLVRITVPPGEEEPIVELVYSAVRREAQATSDFCFFYAAAGLNIAVPESARGTLTPDLVAIRLQRPPEQILAEARQRRNTLLSNDGTKILLTGIIRPNATFAGETALPTGVEIISEPPPPEPMPADADTSGDEDDAIADAVQELVRDFLCPPDKLVALAANPNVVALHRGGSDKLSVTDVRTNVDIAGMLTDLGAHEPGDDVYIGIVDSGVDGTHPAVAGRIHKVWDQTVATDTAHPHPTGTGNNFGQVFDNDADIRAHSVDPEGHGTHVAGIAAGVASGAYTHNGMSTAAKLLVVRTTLRSEHIRRGVEWCFREAGDRPCVVNLSLGSVFTGHDGVNEAALDIRRTFRRVNSSGNGYYWKRGRVVCAAAGNAGASRGHTHIPSLARNASADILLNVAARTNSAGAAIPIQSAFVELFARPLPRTARGARIDVRVRRGTGAAAAATKWFSFVATGASDTANIGTTQVVVVNGPPPPDDHLGLVYTRHQHVTIELLDTTAAGIPTGTWTIEVRSRTPQDIEVDAYVPDALDAERAFRVFFPNNTDRCMMDSPSTAYGVVAVGATVNRASWRPQGAPADGSGDIFATRTTFDPATNVPTALTNLAVGDIGEFTCPGPVRGTRRTIRAMAPGEGVFSARSPSSVGSPQALYGPDEIIDANTVQMGGTSMATPVMTGLVANLLGRHPTLTAKQVIARLEASVTTPAGWDAERFGPGRIDASKILD